MESKYVILRVSKIKSFGQLKEFMLHAERLKETNNADKNKIADNIILQGNPNVLKIVDDYIKDKGIKLTQGKNKSVLCTEMVLSASPEFFKNKDGTINKEKTQRWIKENDKWLRETYGQGYLYATVHRDESTPHISILLCMTKYNKAYKREVLAHKAYFGKTVDKKKNININKLEDLQTEYAERMQAVGFTELQRGKYKSKAKHTDIQKFYTDINKTKEKFLDAVEENKTIVKQLNLEHQKILEKAKIEITARNEIINKVAKEFGIEDEVKKAYPKAKEIAERKVKGSSKGPELE